MLISWFGCPHLAHIWGKGWPLPLPAGDGSIASCAPPWYDEPMDTTPFELTPEQKGMLASLSQETGKPVATLLAAIAAALEDLEAREHAARAPGEDNGHETAAPAPPSGHTPIWERIRATFSNLSEDDLASLPVDGAAQVDHYAYGLPKR